MPVSKDSEHDTLPSVWGSELRHFREQADLSQEDLGDKIGWSRSSVQAAEAGKRPPTPEMAKACDDALGAGGALVRLRKKLLEQRVFTEPYRKWREIEQMAFALRGFESKYVPGLFQTAAYARAMLWGNEQEVEARLERQQVVLHSDKPPTVRYVLDEEVLRCPIGGPAVMAEQLDHLLALAEHDDVRMLILPSGAVPAMHGSLLIASLEGEELGYLETATPKAFVVTVEDEVREMERRYEMVLTEAWPPSASLDLIRKMKEERWKT